MKITVKTLQQFTFKIEIDQEKTVKDLKEQIEKEHGKDYPIASQKLIYSGKILADETKLSEYQIDEKKFVVLMITKAPPPPKPQPASTATSGTETDSKAKKDDKASEESRKAPGAHKAETSSSSAQSSSNTTTSASTPSTVSATNTSSNTTPAPRAAPARPSAEPASLLLAAGAEPQMTDRLASLMSHPHFRQIQDHIQQSPHLVSSTIESLAASDPELYSFITDHPDVFVNALNHPPMAGGRTTTATSGRSNRQVDASRQAEERIIAGLRQQFTQDVPSVSERDLAAVERLKELGFSEDMALQAYMACDRDEQLAADLLFQMDQ